MGAVVSMVNLCWRCVKHRVECIMATNRAQCKNCQVKHYGCLLVPLKESGGGKGGVVGSQKAKVAEGSQTKGRAQKAQKAITLGKLYLSMSKPRCYLGFVAQTQLSRRRE